MKGIYFGSDNDSIINNKILNLRDEIKELKQKYDSNCDELIKSQDTVRTLTTHINELYVLINNMQSKGKE
ncbi:hypothetical protein UFOVP1365_35 [uncultured Caudovirales phage]|uniref:Uncharacterized protein n=1 Tax=uncultured Caudovirales phage TaxID=2100421 RepID=A0A6J5S2U9_9CAUD|nr:hypothetical protein UFOVP1365_35 [uncultured Caudovirales phage]